MGVTLHDEPSLNVIEQDKGCTTPGWLVMQPQSSHVGSRFESPAQGVLFQSEPVLTAGEHRSPRAQPLRPTHSRGEGVAS